jgi:L-fuculose-phosphate aldolase
MSTELGLQADLARWGARAVAAGLVVASGGNLSARLAGSRDFLVTAKGSFLDRLTPGSFVRMTLDGEVVGGGTPSSEWKLHQRTYLARPDVNAVVHLHPEHAVLVDALGQRIRLLTLDHVAYVGSYTRVPFYPNGSDALADAAAAACAESDCVVLAHHGCSAVSSTIDDAFRKAFNLESAARATYRMLLLGDETTEFPPARRATALHQGPSAPIE